MIKDLEAKALELQKNLEDELAEIELGVVTQGYTLADAIREGSTVTGHKTDGWYDHQNGLNACALSAAYIAARARGLIK